MPRHRFGFMGSKSRICEPNQTRAGSISSVRARQSQKFKKKKNRLIRFELMVWVTWTRAHPSRQAVVNT